ncbi:M1 family metallopeptidase [Parvularcula oceani]|uniref:M1 family metallopeptidase n=1 Tax=Parvularcula oceani TaxID=1247963 RepID=UPI00068BBEC0|nr:M1 family metallopeptidase [Parvularcula oceani]
MKRILLSAAGLAALAVTPALAQKTPTFTGVGSGARAFERIDTELPTPNVYRAATGEPGPAYWQQEADYSIEVALDEDEKRIDASQTITYTNNSPHTLRYVWLLMDQNRFADGSLARMSETSSTAGTRRQSSGPNDSLPYGVLARQMAFDATEHGFEVKSITDASGQDLDYTVVDTLMRIDLPEPLRSGGETTLNIDWAFNIINEPVIGGRGGYEGFPGDVPDEEAEDYIFFLAQWFPRMAAFTDYEGWHTQPFLGRGEFTLEFGDYDVAITVPSDHIVSATGELQNPREVLTGEQRRRLREARDAENPVFIVTPEEAAENAAEKEDGTKTWRFSADNVRDFAWSSSRKFIWDAMGFEQEGAQNPLVMAMSFYPQEAEPIWSQYSTEAVIHTMDVYNRFSFDYPYPTAQSVNTWERGGMEYPMITFNGYRPNADDAPDGEITYSRDIKYGLIGVIIHEIGHIYFPMTVNSDERQWTWMDEGINTFLEYVAELEWEEDYPAFRGEPNVLDYITGYMTSTNQVPIMTQSDSILQFGPNAYSKPAAALTILRETVLGRDLFDAAFREYARRWKFKRPTPADFFRSMEETSGKELDWFFRGWWFTTDHVDIGISGVREYRISTQDPEEEFALAREERERLVPEPLAQQRNREEGRQTRVQRRPQLRDFYNENDRFEVTNADRNAYQSFLDGLSARERAVFEMATERDPYVYFMDFENVGGLVMPIPLTLTYEDGSMEEMMIPAEIWRRDAERVTKLMILDKPLASVSLDDNHEIADADRSNNAFPSQLTRSRFELYRSSYTPDNQMARALEELEGDQKTDRDAEEEDMVPLEAGDASGE